MLRKHASRNEALVADSTRWRLIETAERLFGLHGVEGASLRAVSQAAGQFNFGAVQYHFGDKRGLIDAIFEVRLGWLDRRRLELMLHAFADGTARDLRTQVEILYAPIAEIVDEAGRRTYARFLMQCLVHVDEWGPRKYALAEPLDPRNPTVQLYQLLAERLDHLPAPVLRARVDRFLRAFLAAVVEHENTVMAGGPVWPMERLLEDLLDTLAAGIAAPASEAVRQAALAQAAAGPFPFQTDSSGTDKKDLPSKG